MPGDSSEAKTRANPVAAADASTTKTQWLKGQLHLHSNASGDSETPPADVARWYSEHGYDFIVFTDHNRITEIASPSAMLIIPGIELTQNMETCSPRPLPGMACLLHVNGLFVGTDASAASTVAAPTGPDRLELFSHAVEVTEALGGVALLNHPNFHYAADADLITALAGRGLTLLEVANEAVDSNNQGDSTHPSTEALWDAVLTSGAKVWGVASDDAHHYYDAKAVRESGKLAHVGDRGWVMVRADPQVASIRAALERGDFYSTNGVLLSTVRTDDSGTTVSVQDGSPAGPFRFEFIGDEGRVLDEQTGEAATWTWPADHRGYVRVRVRDTQGRTAWTQPAWRTR
ncbi:MAG: CehA/McbA family metallohydrolase [Deltaproteobacteria bacterium]|nr:CehA/McbA family metallohydrolase [Deltaproteobacteria bacterium]